MKIVGKYIKEFNTLTNQKLPCDNIYQSNGLIKHIEKHHPEETGYVKYISTIIKEPEYIGKNPKEDSSIELVKKIDKNVMVCIKLDMKDNYLYVASVYSISDKRFNNRINSGRLKKFDK